MSHAIQMLGLQVAALFVGVLDLYLRRRSDKHSSWPTWLLVPLAIWVALPLGSYSKPPDELRPLYLVVQALVLARWVLALSIRERGLGWLLYVLILIGVPFVGPALRDYARSQDARLRAPHKALERAAPQAPLGLAPVPPSSSVSADDQKFAAIVRFYRETCPTCKFDTPNVHFCDGPGGVRLHINVPVTVEAEYVHPFSPEFLERQSKSPDGLARMITEDLSHLQRKLLFKRSGSRVSYGGASFDCIEYVVQIDPTLLR